MSATRYVLAVVLCGAAQAAPVSFPDFNDTTGLAFVGSTSVSGGVAALSTASFADGRGAMWFEDLVDISNGFSTTFTVSWDGNSDGFAFVIQNDPLGTSALGAAGGFLGYSTDGGAVPGIVNSLAVEFDRFNNGATFNDSGSPQSTVNSCGTAENDVQNAGCHLSAPVGFPVVGPPTSFRVDYDPAGGGLLTVYANDLTNSLYSLNIDLSSTLTLDQGRAYVGFTAGNFFAIGKTVFASWSLDTPQNPDGPSPVPEPATLSLVALGAVFLVLKKRTAGRGRNS